MSILWVLVLQERLLLDFWMSLLDFWMSSWMTFHVSGLHNSALPWSNYKFTGTMLHAFNMSFMYLLLSLSSQIFKIMSTDIPDGYNSESAAQFSQKCWQHCSINAGQLCRWHCSGFWRLQKHSKQPFGRSWQNAERQRGMF